VAARAPPASEPQKRKFFCPSATRRTHGFHELSSLAMKLAAAPATGAAGVFRSCGTVPAAATPIGRGVEQYGQPRSRAPVSGGVHLLHRLGRRDAMPFHLSFFLPRQEARMAFDVSSVRCAVILSTLRRRTQPRSTPVSKMLSAGLAQEWWKRAQTGRKDSAPAQGRSSVRARASPTQRRPCLDSEDLSPL